MRAKFLYPRSPRDCDPATHHAVECIVEFLQRVLLFPSIEPSVKPSSRGTKYLAIRTLKTQVSKRVTISLQADPGSEACSYPGCIQPITTLRYHSISSRPRYPKVPAREVAVYLSSCPLAPPIFCQMQPLFYPPDLCWPRRPSGLLTTQS